MKANNHKEQSAKETKSLNMRRKKTHKFSDLQLRHGGRPAGKKKSPKKTNKSAFTLIGRKKRHVKLPNAIDQSLYFVCFSCNATGILFDRFEDFGEIRVHGRHSREGFATVFMSACVVFIVQDKANVDWTRRNVEPGKKPVLFM